MKNFDVIKTATGWMVTVNGNGVDKFGNVSDMPHIYRNEYLAKLAKQYLKNITITVEVDSEKTDVTIKWSKPKHTRKKL